MPIVLFHSSCPSYPWLCAYLTCHLCLWPQALPWACVRAYCGHNIPTYPAMGLHVPLLYVAATACAFTCTTHCHVTCLSGLFLHRLPVTWHTFYSMFHSGDCSYCYREFTFWRAFSLHCLDFVPSVLSPFTITFSYRSRLPAGLPYGLCLSSYSSTFQLSPSFHALLCFSHL